MIWCFLFLLNHVKAGGWSLVRYVVAAEDPEGTNHVWVIWSRLFNLDTDRPRRMGKQRAAVYYYCRCVSVRNSPLIRFILFYEAPTPKQCCAGWLFWVVSQRPPAGSPMPDLTAITAAVEANILYVLMTATACVCDAIYHCSSPVLWNFWISLCCINCAQRCKATAQQNANTSTPVYL